MELEGKLRAARDIRDLASAAIKLFVVGDEKNGDEEMMSLARYMDEIEEKEEKEEPERVQGKPVSPDQPKIQDPSPKV